MPTPITHIILAHEFFSYCSEIQDHTKFMIGTLFPDIRTPAKLDRKATHFLHPTVDDVKNAPQFKAGMLLHSLIDIIWHKYLTETGIYKLIAPNQLNMGAVKALEDLLVYDSFSDWNSICNMFSTYTEEEKLFTVSDSVLAKWHYSVINYLSVKPCHDSLAAFAAMLGVDEIQAEYGISTAFELSQNKTVVKIMLDFRANFADLLKLAYH